MKLRGLGEFGLIDRIAQRIIDHPLALRGIGDDCAHNRIPAGEELLTSTDMLLQDIHFRLDWTDLEQLGRKAVSVNVSDVAAMGGTPRFLYLGLGLPAEATVEEVDAFMTGFLEEAESYGATLVGGDTCRSRSGWVLSVTVEGSVPPGQAVGREGACVGDLLYVSGSLGESALALDLLNQGVTPPLELAQRHHSPRAQTSLGRALAQEGLASAMIDLSDGLAADLGHILERSGCGARVELGTLPLTDTFMSCGGRLEHAVTGGEDYQLLFSVPPEKASQVERLTELGSRITAIGQMTENPRQIDWIDTTGAAWRPQTMGFNHFGGTG